MTKSMKNIQTTGEYSNKFRQKISPFFWFDTQAEDAAIWRQGWL